MADQMNNDQAPVQNEQPPVQQQQQPPVQQRPKPAEMLAKDFLASNKAARAAGKRPSMMSIQRLGFNPEEGKVKSCALLQEAIITDNDNSHTRDYWTTIEFMGATMDVVIRTWDYVLQEGDKLQANVSAPDGNGNEWINWKYVSNAVKVNLKLAIAKLTEQAELEEAKARLARAKAAQATANRILKEPTAEQLEHARALEMSKLSSLSED